MKAVTTQPARSLHSVPLQLSKADAVLLPRAPSTVGLVTGSSEALRDSLEERDVLFILHSSHGELNANPFITAHGAAAQLSSLCLLAGIVVVL